MIIFYCGHGEIILAWVAGLIHLQKLPHDRIPSLKELETSLPLLIPKECGIPVFLGNDDVNNQVFSIDLSKEEKLAYLTIAGVIADSDAHWSFRDLARISNKLITWGGFLARLGLVKIGRRVTLKGIQLGYLRLAGFVLEPTGLSSDIKRLMALKQS